MSDSRRDAEAGRARTRTRRTRSTSSARSCARRDGREFAGVNVENAAYPLGVCAEKCAIVAAVTAGYRPGDIAAIGITASPCGGCRSGCTSAASTRSSYRRADGKIATHSRRTCCRTPGNCLLRSGFVAVAGAAERRQVDARERAHRREGRDRLRQAAHDAPPDPRRAHDGRRAARARRPAGLAAADRHAHRADAGPVDDAIAERRRRRPARRQRARADRRRRPLRRPARLRARRAGRSSP